MELKEDQQRRSECAEALLDLLQTTESPEPTQLPSDSPQPEDTSGILNDQQDAGCQTDLTMEDIERMEDVLRQNTTELGDLRTKALDTKFNQESFEKNEEKTTFYTGLPNFLVLLLRFDIGDSVGFYCASLKMPAFTRGKSQLSAYEVEETRKIANVRIHVERVIGLVRRKYQILQSRAVPIEHMLTKPGEALALIDKIGVICCALSNLSVSVVPLE
ncbi:hypothetical protein KUCAC02_006089 [Chaenocephalus aceratus]|uniref:Uncharacterized protein n=1 Tax=Chaenocephalus aceratus TaxID=36190 RepID=A0ACB9WQU5_CHAAC|nr:hypothetical protein KUCAC02_006089 [Chaenocephalus aceratus]